MVESYAPKSAAERVAVQQEVMQLIALAGLARGGFFEKAAFYGGRNTQTKGRCGRWYGMLAISAKTGEVREAKTSEFKEAWRSGVRLRGPLRIKERF
jgi:hypothetical protein